jgi:ATP synthase F1 delta subunit
LKKNKNSKKYAKMFLNAVGIEGAPKALEELALVNALMEQSAEFSTLLINPMFTTDERAGAIASVGERLNLSSDTVKFMGFLSDKRAAAAMKDVLDKAVAIYSEKMSRATATVITSVEIGTEYESRLKESLKEITQKEVSLEYAVDPSLIGGMLIKVGSMMFDGSIRGQLRLLKEELIKG